MPQPNRYLRRSNFARDKANGVTFDPSKLDAEFNDLALVCQQFNDRFRGITNADGTLKNITPAAAKDLLALNRFVATVGQTAFTMPTYDSVNDVALVWSNGLALDLSTIVQTNSTTVTIPARAGGEIVIVAIFTAGSGLLTKLADAVTAGQGASLIGVRDIAGVYVATDVETALFEVMTALQTLITNLGPLSAYVKADGSVPLTGNLPAGGNKITGLAAATTNGDAVRYEQLQAYVNSLANIVNNYLPLAGGTMTGNIDLGGVARIKGGIAPVTQDELSTKDYVDTTLATATAALVAPTGSVTMFGGSAIPTGWLECNGQAVSRTGYANLFAVVGTTWGPGDSVTTFNVPDLRGRAPIGVGQGTSDLVMGVTLVAGGSGYTSVPTVTLSGGGGAGATAEAVLTAGVVTAIRLLTRGNGYTSDPSISITGGGGTGASATASRLMSTRALAQLVGEESHIQAPGELAHTSRTTITTGTGIGGGSTAAAIDGSFGNSDAMNNMQPSAGIRFLMKT